MRVKCCRDVRFVRPLNLHKNHLQEQKFFRIFAEKLFKKEGNELTTSCSQLKMTAMQFVRYCIKH